MKKLILLVLLGIATSSFFSCTRSCVCVNPDGKVVQEFEVDPSEKCSSRSSDGVECS